MLHIFNNLKSEHTVGKRVFLPLYNVEYVAIWRGAFFGVPLKGAHFFNEKD